MFFDELMIIIIKTLLNNHVNFKFDNVNKESKIVEYQSIDDIFVSFNIIDIEFQNENIDQRKIVFIIYKNIFDGILNVEFNYNYQKKNVKS